MKTSVIEVHDMLSVLSVDEVEKRIGKVPGVESATVNYAAGSATVRYDETRLEVADIKAAVHQRGHQSEGESLPGEQKPAIKPSVVPTPEAAPGAQPSTPEAALPKASPAAMAAGPAPDAPSTPVAAGSKAPQTRRHPRPRRPRLQRQALCRSAESAPGRIHARAGPAFDARSRCAESSPGRAGSHAPPVAPSTPGAVEPKAAPDKPAAAPEPTAPAADSHKGHAGAARHVGGYGA